MKTELLNKAISIAAKAHENQTDRYGAPYLGHVMRVMNYGKTLEEKIVGALHDTVEDTDITLEDLARYGFPTNIVFAVDCLTKRETDADYQSFVKRTEKSPLAVAVKLNDLRDNMDLRRATRALTEKDLKRLNKYLKAYHYLIEKY